jgi:hypothetical protein
LPETLGNSITARRTCPISPGGITPTCPTAPVVENICGSPGALMPGFVPDLKKIENRIDLAILVKF